MRITDARGPQGPPTSVDEFVMTTSQLDDGELIQLAYIHGVLSNDTGLSDPVRGWHANLALGIAQVMAARRDALVALERDLASSAGMGAGCEPKEG